MNAEFHSKQRKAHQPQEADWLQLSISICSAYEPPSQPPPPRLSPPESPPHPSLLQLMPPSSSPSLQPSSSIPSSSLQLHPQGMFLPLQPHQQMPGPPILYFSQPEQPHTPPCYASLYPMFPEQQPQPPADRTQTPEPTLSSSPEGQARPSGAKRRSRNRQKPGWEATIEPPYPWAKSSRAKVFSMDELLSRNIGVISGDVQCKRCKKQYEIEYDLKSKFSEVASFIGERNERMHDRAPEEWRDPEASDCKFCGYEKCVEPMIEKKRWTNWVFLFLGQMIGYCDLRHLKYFCKYNNLHRTGAKNRLLYYTYMDLYRQLDPNADVCLPGI